MIRLRNLLCVLAALLLVQAWGSRAAQAGYTLVSSDTFGRSDTAYGSPGNGLVDASGDTWGVKSNLLKVDPGVGGSTATPCVRPSGEATISGKVRVTITDNGNSAGAVGRYFVSGGQINDYNVFLYSSGTQMYINTIVAGTYHQSSLGGTITLATPITSYPVILELSWVQSTDGMSTTVTETLYNPSSGAILGSPSLPDTYSQTDTTPALQGQAGVGGVQVFNLYASYSEMDTYSYTVGGAITAGSISVSALTDFGPDATYGWAYKSPLKNSVSIDVNGSGGGFSTLNYTYQFRITGASTWTTAGGAAQSTARYSFGLPAPPGTSYDIQVVVGDASGTTPATTMPITITTPKSVILFEGDSTTEGVNLEATGTPFTSWPLGAQTYLAGQGVYIAALNGGHPGSTSTGIVGTLITGSGSSARFTTAILGYIAQYSIDTLVFKAGANDVQDGATANDSTPVGTITAAYVANVQSLAAACAAAGVRLQVDYPFWIPAPSGAAGAEWTAPLPYLTGINTAIDTLDSTWVVVRGSIHGFSGTGSYQVYCMSHTGMEVHPPQEYYVSFGPVWAADYLASLPAFNHRQVVKVKNNFATSRNRTPARAGGR